MFVGIFAQAMSSSVDGDCGRGSEASESVDGDEGNAPVPVEPRRRGPGRVQSAAAAARTDFRKVGKLMIVFIFASSFGLWQADLSDLDLHNWTDVVYGQGDTRLLGAVLTRWEFTDGSAASAGIDENIFLDLAQLHQRGRQGVLIYRAIKSIILDSADTVFEYPTTIFKVLKRFGDFMCKEFVKDGTPTAATFKDFIRQWKAEHDIVHSGIHCERFCPKAAWMCLNGWQVYHAVAVSPKFRGTPIIGI